MIDDNSGILVVNKESPGKLCYFEVSDLNVDLPINVIDTVMVLNRMAGIRVRLQARMIDETAEIQYISNVKGVQIIGELPSYMKQVTLKKAEVSRVQTGPHSEKVLYFMLYSRVR